MPDASQKLALELDTTPNTQAEQAARAAFFEAMFNQLQAQNGVTPALVSAQAAALAAVDEQNDIINNLLNVDLPPLQDAVDAATTVRDELQVTKTIVDAEQAALNLLQPGFDQAQTERPAADQLVTDTQVALADAIANFGPGSPEAIAAQDDFDNAADALGAIDLIISSYNQQALAVADAITAHAENVTSHSGVDLPQAELNLAAAENLRDDKLAEISHEITVDLPPLLAAFTLADANLATASSALTAANLALTTAQTNMNNELDGSVNTPTEIAADAAFVAAQAALVTAQSELTAAQTAHSNALAGIQNALNTINTNISNLAVKQGLLDDAQDALTVALAAAGGEANDLIAIRDAAQEAVDAANLPQVLIDHGLNVTAEGSVIIDNRSADIGLSPSNSGWMTLFGQFFDHGLDLVTKGGNGTVYIPLMPDDPNYVEGSPTNFMTLTRATMIPVVQPDGSIRMEAENTTTPFVDQNQTYTSHASHQVFLREYAIVGGKPVPTGHLLDNVNGGIATWGDTKAQAAEKLGIILEDTDVLNVPLLHTDPYGGLILSANGRVQIVTGVDSNGNPNAFFEAGAPGTPVALPPTTIRTGHAFLNDIAHSAAPNGTADSDSIAGGSLDLVAPGTYDDELLDSHFITGDGRGNENIGLTAVHFIFHAEHNRAVEADKLTVLRSGDINIIKEWLADHNITALPNNGVPFPGINASDAALKAYADTLTWDGERLFQAGRFTTEMQYQHMVFEEFARRVQPNVDPFIFSNSADLDPAIVAEFAHTVYRFGHSQLTDTVDRLNNDLATVDGGDQITLVNAFLNPAAYQASSGGPETGTSDFDAAANIIRGMTRQVGQEIDEFVVDSLRNFLVGLPLDLAALNMARARDTGIPGLNEARHQLYEGSGHPDVKPYTSWLDFSQHLKNPMSLINFIAAYGTHQSIEDATTIEAKRDAAVLLVFGDFDVDGDGDLETAPPDRLDFLNGTGIYGNQFDADGKYKVEGLGGMNGVDLWIGGLAEELNEFGGQLGSTFNFVFEYQLEHLQNGDRFYYLSRTQGMNLLNQLEGNTFTDIIMRNTSLGSDIHSTHMVAEAMEVPDMILELDLQVAQANYSGDAANDGLTTSENLADRILLDAKHEDPFLQATDPKIVRVMGTTDIDNNGFKDGNILKFSGGEHVVLGGTEGNDTLLGDKGIDTLWGDGGNDYLNAGMESDQVFGGEGDDIIEDPFGDDFLRGEAGNDVIVNGAGLDILFGGTGNDFIMAVTDTTEVFAGEGNDFILGGSAPDGLLGNEGDDWIEGGEGFDGLSGENSELFFNSPIIGHDILNGQGNDTDYDGENGNDIMVQGAGIQRNNGMDGFDWAIHKGDVAAADSDLGLKNFLTAQPLILRDRFDSVEGLSGWKFDDTLSGSATPLLQNANFQNELEQQDADQIRGLQDVIGVARAANATDVIFGNSNINGNSNSEIILGGGGSDTIRGALGNDVLDGDAWLNVRISIRDHVGNFTPAEAADATSAASLANPEIYSVDSLTSIIPIGAAGVPAPWQGHSLADLMRTGVINPGQLTAVREILYDNATNGSNPADSSIDLAVYGDIRANYNITNNGDGSWTVAHVTVTTGLDSDGVDHVRNIEVLRFADQTVNLVPIVNNVATGNLALAITNGTGAFNLATRLEVGDTLTVSLADPDGAGPLSAVADLDGVPAINGFEFTWQAEQTPGAGDFINIIDPNTGATITGRNFTPTSSLLIPSGASLRVVGTFRDGHSVPETVYSLPTQPLAGGAPVVPDPLDLGTDLVGTIVDGAALPVGSVGILEDAAPLTITAADFLAGTTDIDTPLNQLFVTDVTLRLRDGRPVPGTFVPTVDAQGHFISGIFTPAANFNGGVTFTINVSDGTNVTAAEAALAILPVNDSPTTIVVTPLGSTLAGTGAQPITFTTAQLLSALPVDNGGRTEDVDGDRPILIVPGSVTSPRGNIVDNGDGTFTFTATAPRTVGPVTINFQLDDGTGLPIPAVGEFGASAIGDGTATLSLINAAPVSTLNLNDTTPSQGQLLSLVGAVTDANGLGAVSRQWQSSNDGGTSWNNIAGATGTTFTAPADGSLNGQVLRVQVSFTDQGGTAETAFTPVSAPIAPNATPTGAPTISELITATNPLTTPITPTEGQQLTAASLGIADADTIVSPITYQWQSSNNGTTWSNITGATNATFTPQDLGGSLQGAQAGQQLRVLASFVDGLGKTENVASVATGPVGVNWAATAVLANTFNGTAGDDIIAGTNSVALLGGGNDTLRGAAGNDRLIYNFSPAGFLGGGSSGRDIIDGGTTGAGPTDTSTDFYVLNGVAGAETFRIYARSAWLGIAGNTAAQLQAGTEIVITRNGTNNASVISELDNIEEIVINNTGVSVPVVPGTAGGDTIQVIGNFSSTSLNFNTITVNGSGGDDVVDVSGLTSAHHVVLNSGGGNDQLVGMRAQDEFNATDPIVFDPGSSNSGSGNSGSGNGGNTGGGNSGGSPSFTLTAADIAGLHNLVSGTPDEEGEVPVGVRDPSGHGNNVANPNYGATDEAFIRITSAHYGAPDADGNRAINPIFADLDARNISNILSAQETDLPKSASGANIFFMAFGQYFDHGLDFVAKGGNGTIAIGGEGVSATTDNPADLTRASVVGFDADGNPMHVNKTSPFVDQNQAYGSHTLVEQFLREGDGQGGLTSHLLAGAVDPMDPAHNLLPTFREVILNHWNNNTVFHKTDGSSISFQDANPDLVAGGVVNEAKALALVTNFMGSGQNLYLDSNPYISVLDHYAAGDGRANENVTLTAMHTIWARNHNFHVENLKDAGFVGSEEELFQAARMINEAEYQRVVFTDFADHLIGGIKGVGDHGFDEYKPSTDARISEEFASAVYRVGHSLISDTLTVLDADGNPTEVKLVDAFLNPTNATLVGNPHLPPGYVPQPGYAQLGVGNILGGIATQQAEEVDFNLVDAVRNDLVRLRADLAAFNIARGWDVGLGTMNQVRADLKASSDPYVHEAVGYAGDLSPYTSWDDFQTRNGLSDTVIAQFKAAYPDLVLTTQEDIDAFVAANPDIELVDGNTVKGIDRVDLWVGGLAEKHINNGQVGQTFWVVLHEQFDRLQEGDRFYYIDRFDNFDFYQNIVEDEGFAAIVARNTALTNLPEDIFAVSNDTNDGADDEHDNSGSGTDAGNGQGDGAGAGEGSNSGSGSDQTDGNTSDDDSDDPVVNAGGGSGSGSGSSSGSTDNGNSSGSGSGSSNSGGTGSGSEDPVVNAGGGTGSGSGSSSGSTDNGNSSGSGSGSSNSGTGSGSEDPVVNAGGGSGSGSGSSSGSTDNGNSSGSGSGSSNSGGTGSGSEDPVVNAGGGSGSTDNGSSSGSTDNGNSSGAGSSNSGGTGSGSEAPVVNAGGGSGSIGNGNGNSAGNGSGSGASGGGTSNGSTPPVVKPTHLSGDKHDNILRGHDGENVLHGKGGHDRIWGGADSDDVYGEKGNDQLWTGGGDDRAHGGAGSDRMKLGSGNDEAWGNRGKDTVHGGAGNDTFHATARDGADTYYGGNAKADSGDDMLDMSAILTRIEANLGSGSNFKGHAITEGVKDVLYGIENIVTGSGDDVIHASVAHNTMGGGDGKDTFVFKSAAHADGDTIQDFQAGDRIDVSSFMGDTVQLVNGPASAGQISVSFEEIDGQQVTVLQGNTDGDPDSEFTLHINGHHNLNGSSFA